MALKSLFSTDVDRVAYLYCTSSMTASIEPHYWVWTINLPQLRLFNLPVSVNNKTPIKYKIFKWKKKILTNNWKKHNIILGELIKRITTYNTTIYWFDRLDLHVIFHNCFPALELPIDYVYWKWVGGWQAWVGRGRSWQKLSYLTCISGLIFKW